MTRKRLMILAGAVVALALVAVGVVVLATGHLPFRGDDDRTDLQRAVSLTPSDTERLSWTDWSGVRQQLGTDRVRALISRGFAADLTSTSALVDSADVLDRRFGFSPATLDWELFSQSEAGAVIIMGLPDGAADDVAASLRTLGFSEPDAPTGRWDGGADLLARIGKLTPELSYFSIDADRNLLLSSDTAQGLDRAIAAARKGDGGPDVSDVVAAMGAPLSAAIYTGPQACNALAMAGADPAARAQGDQLLAAAGHVNPLTGFAIGAEPGDGVRVAMSFETEKQARENADTRAVLAAGPAPGQGGNFSDRFRLGKVEADGDVVTMALEPVEGAYVVSDLSSGPVLFATC